MEKASFVFLFFLLSLPLAGCKMFSFSDDDSWKETYGSVELFLENAIEPRRVYAFSGGTRLGTYEDREKSVANAILESGSFTSVEQTEAGTKNYCVYEAYWQAATTGPNYCNLSVYTSGLLVIDHKVSLGKSSYLYFSMDAEKASEIVDMVFSLAQSESL